MKRQPGCNAHDFQTLRTGWFRNRPVFLLYRGRMEQAHHDKINPSGEDEPGFTINDSHKDYLEIVITGLLHKTLILNASRSVLNHPDYYTKNTLWDFTRARMGLNIQELKEIIGILGLFRPQKSEFANRGAFLVKGRMNASIANMFVGMTALLPFKYRVFSDIQNAKAYVKQ